MYEKAVYRRVFVDFFNDNVYCFFTLNWSNTINITKLFCSRYVENVLNWWEPQRLLKGWTVRAFSDRLKPDQKTNIELAVKNPASQVSNVFLFSAGLIGVCSASIFFLNVVVVIYHLTLNL